MADMPTLGRQAPSPVRKIAGTLFVVGILLTVVLVVRHRQRAKREVVASPISQPILDAAPALAFDLGHANANDRPEELAKKDGPQVVSVKIDGPLETALVARLGRVLGQALTPVIVRSLVWWVRVPEELRKGDQIEVVFEEHPPAEPVISALRFHSEKAQTVFAAYRFQPAGDRFSRMYLPTGEELEKRLVDGPIDDYDQVTSLLRDGRNHQGIDFKTPVGTSVKAPFEGQVARRNWNFRGNGNCVEIRADGDRRSAMFLHLSEASVAVGSRVHKGDVIAKSGNSGHSFAPHLHYQLMSSRGVLDPFEVHATVRRRLPEGQKSVFETEVKRLDGEMDSTAKPHQ